MFNGNKRTSSRSRGYLIPGYNYCGPGNPLKNGRPTSFTDRMCRLHDFEYQKIIDKGGNPYIKFNYADQRLLDNLKGRSDIGSRAAIAFFTAKKYGHKLMYGYGYMGHKWRQLKGRPYQLPKLASNQSKVTDHFSNVKRRRISSGTSSGSNGTGSALVPYGRGPVTSSGGRSGSSGSAPAALSKNKMKDEDHFKKTKFVAKRIVGTSKTKSGNWLPMARHKYLVGQTLESQPNEYQFLLRNVITLDAIQRHMFNPRYMKEWNSAGGSTSVGATRLFFNQINASTQTKGIFQFGANSGTGAAESQYTIGGVTPHTDITNAAPPNNEYEIMNVYHGILYVKCVVNTKLINNFTKPVFVQMFDIEPRCDAVKDFNSVLSSSVNMRGTKRLWDVDSTTTNADSAINSTDPYKDLTFSFNRLPKKSAFFKQYKLTNKRIVRLDPGEHCKVRRVYSSKFDLATAVQRLVLLGYRASVNNLAAAEVGIVEDQTDPFALSFLELAGISKSQLYQIRGETGTSAADAVGTFGSKVVIRDEMDYSWSMKGFNYMQVPTYGNAMTATPTALVLDEQHQIV